MNKFKNLCRKIIHIINGKEIINVPNMINAPNILEGKVALITGGSSGIGYAIAETFLKCGCKVIISGSNEEKLVKAASMLKGGVLSILL